MKKTILLTLVVFLLFSQIAFADSTITIQSVKYINDDWQSFVIDNIELYDTNDNLITSCSNCKQLVISTKNDLGFEWDCKNYEIIASKTGYVMKKNPQEVEICDFGNDLIRVKMEEKEEIPLVDIEITNPENLETYDNENVIFSYQIKSGTADTIWYSLNGGPNTTITGSTTLNDLSEGDHTVTIYANNSEGIESSDTILFSINLPDILTVTINSPIGLILTDNVDLDFDIMGVYDTRWYVLDGSDDIEITGPVTFENLEKGFHIITVYANNSEGTEFLDSEIFEVAIIELVEIEITSPVKNYYQSTELTLSYEILKGKPDIDQIWYNYECDSLSKDNTTIVGNDVPLFLEKGVCTINIFANNTLGDEAHDSTQFEIISPVVMTITSPENTTYFSNFGTATVNLDVNFDRTPDNVNLWYRLNGGDNITVNIFTELDAYHLLDGEPTMLTDDTYLLEVFTENKDGSESTDNVTFTVEPEIVPIILSPSDGSTINTDHTTLKYTTTIGGTPDQVWYNLDGGLNTTITGDTEITGLINGDHTIILFANNSQGTEFSDSSTFTVNIIDAVEISITSPTDLEYDTTELTLSYEITNGVVDETWYNYECTGIGEGGGYSGGIGNTTITGQNDISLSLAEDTCTINIFANNSLGIESFDSVSFDIVLPTVDKIIFEITAPSFNIYNLDETNLNYDIIQGIRDKVWYSLDNGNNITFSGTATLTSLEEGNHNITVYMNNSEGVESSEFVEFVTGTTYYEANLTFIDSISKKDIEIDNVKIYVGTSTNKDPIFSFDNTRLATFDAPPGDYTIIIEKQGYTTKEAKITVFNIIETNSNIQTIIEKGFSIEILSPVDTVYDHSDLTFEYETDDTPDQVWYSLDGGENITFGTKQTDEIDLIFLEGDHNITIFANNSEKIEASDFIEFTIALDLEFELTSPTPTVYDTNTIPLTYDITQGTPDTMWYSLNNGETVIITDAVTFTNLPEGLHNVTLFGNNSLGKETNKTVSFSIDLPDAQPPAPGGSISSGGPSYNTRTLNISIPEEMENTTIVEAGSTKIFNIGVLNTHKTKTMRTLTVYVKLNKQKWNITIDPKKIELGPGNNTYFKIKVNIPENATNSTITFRAKGDSSYIKDQKIEFIVVPKGSLSTPSESEDTETTSNETSNTGTEENTTTGNATGFFAAVSEVNPIYAFGIFITMMIIATMIYIYFKDVQETEAFMKPIIKQVKTTKKHNVKNLIKPKIETKHHTTTKTPISLPKTHTTHSPSYRSRFR